MIILFYLMALIPVAVGAALWVFKHEIVWWEWLISTALAFAVSGIMHAIAIFGMTADTETWSGQSNRVVFHPRWVEEYQQMHTRTVGSGKNQRTETYYTTEHRTHREHWKEHANFGKDDAEFDIGRNEYDEVGKKFGGKVIVTQPPKSGFDGGDRNIYTIRNQTRYIKPAIIWKRWTNRIKVAPSVFSFVKVPETMKVYNYPKNDNWKRSDRLVGTAGAAIPILQWDQMCSRLGPRKKVNVILVGFGDKDSMYAQYQQAKWLGGKKNDLVLCYGGPNVKPTWTFVFGWSESELAKKNLQSLLLDGPVDLSIIPKIETEIRNNYTIKDWSKFDYIAVEPPQWSYFVLIGIMVLSQSIVLGVSYFNKTDKSTSDKRERKVHY